MPTLIQNGTVVSADGQRQSDVLFEGETKAVIELASFDRFSPAHQAFLDQLTESIGIVLNTIEANTRTEDLLKQSQSLGDLQSLTSRRLPVLRVTLGREPAAGWKALVAAVKSAVK